MNDDRFFERLAADARPLRYQLDDVAAARIRARVAARVRQPGLAEVLASWFRPLAATLTAIAVAAAIGTVALGTDDEAVSFADASVDVVMAGEVYRVVD